QTSMAVVGDLGTMVGLPRAVPAVAEDAVQSPRPARRPATILPLKRPAPSVGDGSQATGTYGRF
ncbi:MAG: hypothetical protein AB7P34_07475, partial [Vicinamibacterales bacterium]